MMKLTKRHKQKSFFPWANFSFFSRMLLLTGIILRGCAYFFSGIFRVDESWVALQVAAQNIFQLLKGQKFYQAVAMHAPGFMVLEKIFTKIFSTSPLAYRFFPFFFSLGGLVLFYFFLKKNFSRKIFLFCFPFFVFSPAVIRYSATLKPYSLNLFLTILLFVWAKNALDKKNSTERIFFLNLAGMVFESFSMSIVFILIGINLFFLQKFLKNPKKVKRNIFLISNLGWISFFLFLYYGVYARALSSNKIFDMWQSAFLPFQQGFWACIKWSYFSFVRNIQYLTGHDNASLVAFFLLGFFSMVQRDRENSLFFFFPIAVVFWASCFQKFPFFERLILFLSPAFFIFIAEGIVLFLNFVPRRFFRPAQVLLFFWVIFSPLKNTLGFFSQQIVQPAPQEQLEILNKTFRPGDTLLINNSGQFFYGYCHGQKQLTIPSGFIGIFFDFFKGENVLWDAVTFKDFFYNQQGFLKGYKHNDKVKEALENNFYALTHNPRTWVLFFYLPEESKQKYLQAFKERGRLLFKDETTSADLYLWDMSQKEARP